MSTRPPTRSLVVAVAALLGLCPGARVAEPAVAEPPTDPGPLGEPCGPR